MQQSDTAINDDLDDYDDYDCDRNNNESIELHQYVFKNDLNLIQSYIDRHKTKFIEKLCLQDHHGNTALHLACMMGRIDIVKRLIHANCKVKIRNRQMWTPLNEAISYGNRDLIKIVLQKFEQEVDFMIDDAKPKIIRALADMIDFYVEIKWDFESWIPLVSRFLPSDVCKLYKKGTKIRIDCTLGDIAAAKGGNGDDVSSTKQGNNGTASGGGGGGASSGSNATGGFKASAAALSWQRGDLTFLFDIEQIGKKNSIIFMDNKRKIFMNIEKDINVEHDLEKEIDLYLSREMIFLKLNTKNANFQPTKVGWFSKRDKIEAVNGYTCQFYDVNNLFIVSKLRTEHLTDEDIKKNEEKQRQLKKSMNQQQQQQKGQLMSSNYEQISGESNENSYEDFTDLMKVDYKPSLPPPPDSHVSWEEYINSTGGNWPTLGRKTKLKESRKEFKAQIAVVCKIKKRLI